ncbi:MAG: YneF family protein [Firmicutes bacterium]|nr:YneF family protein [Bacillota bacterium]
MIWVMLAIGLVVGAIGGGFLGVWLVRRSMSKMQMDDEDIAQMARKMGMNVNPKQLQVIKQQMRKAGQNPPPLIGKKKQEETSRPLAIPPKQKKK